MLYICIVAVVIILTVVISKKISAAATAKRIAAEAAAEKIEEKRREDEVARRRKAEQAAKEKAAREKEAATQAAIEKVPGSEKYRLQTQQTEWHGHILTITEFTPISKKQFVAFDTETTGLDETSDEIVELAAVRVVDGVITEEFTQLINPGIWMPEAAAKVNHITDEMLHDQPKIYEALPAFLSFVGDDVIAAHNAAFDAKFLAQACMRYNFKAPERFFDTMSLARYYPAAPDKKLKTLIACAGIKNTQPHRALGDARAVAELVVRTNELRAKKS